MGRDMPIGWCCVCEDDLDLSDAGICGTCKNGFCWGQCGTWHRGQHCCDHCKETDEDEEE